jgi:hypothetical protein
MKTAIYLSLLLILPGMLLAKPDSLSVKLNKQVQEQVSLASPIEKNNSSAVKHDTVYVAVKEMPGDAIFIGLTTAELIGALTILLTLAALIASITFSGKAVKVSQGSLKEMKEQRLSSYRPEIFLFSDYKYYIEKRFDKPYTESIRSNIRLTSRKERTLKVLNLGGNAKEITIHSLVDLTDKISALKNALEFADGVFHLSNGAEINAGINVKECRHFDYMLPAVDADSKHETLALPFEYFSMLMELAYKAKDNAEFGEIFSGLVPPITLTILYYDIHGTPYTKILSAEFANVKFHYGLTPGQLTVVHFNLRMRIKE